MIEVIAVNISPEMGERIVISGLRDSILEVFPEIGERGEAAFQGKFLVLLSL